MLFWPFLTNQAPKWLCKTPKIMSIEIRPVNGKKEMKIFVQFANKMYKGNPYYCPSLDFDEINTLTPGKNPALDFCERELFLAWRDGKCVGRVAAMINPIANEKWNCKKVRFGWFDFLDDEEISRALLDKVVEWGKAHGMDELNGPVGFTDFDKEGLLIHGFEELSPMPVLYNAPYYEHHLVNYGLEKEADWLEYRAFVPEALPERWVRIADIASKRSRIHNVKVHSAKELNKRYPNLEYFKLLTECYSVLYNYQPLTEKQQRYVANLYFGLLNFDFVSLVENENNELIALGLGMPDLTKALQHCSNGSLFPFGWYHMLKALKAKKIEVIDELLIAVRPDYQDSGAVALIFNEQFPYYKQYGVHHIETTSILETNHKNAANFTCFEHIQHKRRRAYLKHI